MRLSTTKPLRVLPLIAIAAGIIVTAVCSTISRADTAGYTKDIGDVRLGIFYPQSDAVRNVFTTTIPDIGLDYILTQDPGTSRTLLGADFIQRTSGASKMQIIPVTISQQYYHTLGGTSFTPYGELGVGAYFLSLNETSVPALTSTNSLTSLGGFVGGGVDLTSSVFIDARYNLIGTLKGQNPSGYQFSLGLRF
jgi:hypothetical protein